MAFSFGATSAARLSTCHPDIQRVLRLAITRTPIDFMIVEGVRTDEQAYVNFGKGRTVAQLAAAGVPNPERYAKPRLAKVTWLKNPLSTKHRKQADGWSHAVDVLPAPYDWKDIKLFDAVATVILTCAKELGVAMRWGRDWDGDGVKGEKGETDGPHFELVR